MSLPEARSWCFLPCVVWCRLSVGSPGLLLLVRGGAFAAAIFFLWISRPLAVMILVRLPSYKSLGRDTAKFRDMSSFTALGNCQVDDCCARGFEGVYSFGGFGRGGWLPEDTVACSEGDPRGGVAVAWQHFFFSPSARFIPWEVITFPAQAGSTLPSPPAWRLGAKQHSQQQGVTPGHQQQSACSSTA